LICALAAATCYGIGPLVQALAARQTETGSGLGLGLLARLARNKLWLAGVGADLGGFGFEAIALALAPAAFVTPLLLFDMVVLGLLASRVVHERLSRPGILGIAAILSGGVLLTAAFATSHHGVGRQARLEEQFVMVGIVALAAVGAFFAGRRSPGSVTAALLAGASGIAYAMATLCTRQISLSLRDHDFWHQLLTPAPYLLAVAALLSLSLLSRALQAGAAVVAVPVTSAFAALLPAIAGLAVFGEPVPRGGALVGFIAALPLLLAGLIMLARQGTVGEILAAEAGAGPPPTGEPAAITSAV
jgi:multidrug transporter EmrE-like cation transporter